MSPVKKKKKPRKRPTKRKQKTSLSKTFKKIVWTCLLAGLLFFSVGTLGYVVFFRTVLAAEVDIPEKADFVFEEPHPPFQKESVLVSLEVKNKALPRVAIIVDDMGYHPQIGRQLIELPFGLTFSFLANAPHTRSLEERAYQQKRTILLHLPLQPRDDKWDLGPGALVLGEMNQQKEILIQNLAAVPHAVGVNNHMGSLYTEDKVHMKGLMELIGAEDLFYIDSFTTPKSVGLQVAGEVGVKTARRHLFLDNVPTKTNVCIQLVKLVRLAEKQGWAIGIGHPYQTTLDGLRECNEIFSERVELVGVEELVK